MDYRIFRAMGAEPVGEHSAAVAMRRAKVRCSCDSVHFPARRLTRARHRTFRGGRCAMKIALTASLLAAMTLSSPAFSEPVRQINTCFEESVTALRSIQLEQGIAHCDKVIDDTATPTVQRAGLYAAWIGRRLAHIGVGGRGLRGHTEPQHSGLHPFQLETHRGRPIDPE